MCKVRKLTVLEMCKIRAAFGFILPICTLLLTVLTYDYGWAELLAWLLVLLMGGSFLVGVCSCFWGKMRLGVVDGLMLAWWMYMLLRVYLQPDVPCCREVVTYTSLYLLYIVFRFSDATFRLKEDFFLWILLGTVVYELVFGAWQVYAGTSRHPLYPVTGSFFNPGPYSALIAMGMVMAICLLNQQKKVRKMEVWVGGFILVGGCMMLALTRSRSAMVVVAAMALYQYRLMLRRYWLLALSLVMLGAATLFWLKFESAMGRIVLWWQSVCIWLDHPIWGAGIGTFTGEYGKQLEAFFSSQAHVRFLSQYADATDFAFCDFLQLLAEQGMIGGVLCLAIIGLSLRSLYREERVLFFAFVALLVFSLFSYPFQLLPYQMLAMVFVARAARNEGRIRMPHWASLLSLVCVGALAFYCHGIAKERVEALQEYKQCAGLVHGSFVKDYYRLYPLCRDDKQFLFDFAKILQANQRYLDSNAMLRDGILVSNDPMFWVLMGNNYRWMRMYGKAESCYDTAFRRMPNRIYPLYKKMLLFQELHNKKGMLSVAIYITTFQEKVSSPAVDEMKSKARSLLNHDVELKQESIK